MSIEEMNEGQDFAIPTSLLHRPQGTEISKSMLLGFINKLEGYKTKFKNEHWSAVNDMMHQRVDQFLDALMDFQDNISEDIQGTVGQFSPGEIKGTDINCNTPIECIKLVWTDIINWRRILKDKEDYIGVVNEIEGFCHTVKKSMYLFNLSK
jgi:hypothetical protein